MEKYGGVTMGKYAIIHRESCIGCGNCEVVAPELFELDEEMIAFVKLDHNQGSIPIPKGNIDFLEEAVEECPTESIKVSDQPFNK